MGFSIIHGRLFDQLIKLIQFWVIGDNFAGGKAEVITGIIFIQLTHWDWVLLTHIDHDMEMFDVNLPNTSVLKHTSGWAESLCLL